MMVYLDGSDSKSSILILLGSQRGFHYTESMLTSADIRVSIIPAQNLIYYVCNSCIKN